MKLTYLRRQSFSVPYGNIPQHITTLLEQSSITGYTTSQCHSYTSTTGKYLGNILVQIYQQPILSTKTLSRVVTIITNSPQCGKMGDVRCISKGHFIVCPTHRASYSADKSCVQCKEAQHRKEKSLAKTDNTTNGNPQPKKPPNKKNKWQTSIKQQRRERQKAKLEEVGEEKTT